VRFRLVHKLTSYLLAGTALATLATSESASWVSLVVLAVAATLSWFVEPDTRLGTLVDRAVPLFNLATVAFFALAMLQVARSFPEVDLSPFLDFVLFLLGYKLCQRRGNRDYLQIYILSFLVMLAAAWQATSALFIVGFLLYVFLATWTLILFHLRREIEENYLVPHTGDVLGARVTVTRVLNSRRVDSRAGVRRRGPGLRQRAARGIGLRPGWRAPPGRRGRVLRRGQVGHAWRVVARQPDRGPARSGSPHRDPAE
jgi:hypothetical protein